MATVKGIKREKHPKMSEDELQKEVIALFKDEGWFIWWIPNWMYRLAMMSLKKHKRRDREWPESGLPDIIALQGLDDKREPARLLFIELKSANGRVSPTQRNWLTALRRIAGVETYVFYPKDFRDGTIRRVCMNGPKRGHEGTERLFRDS